MEKTPSRRRGTLFFWFLFVAIAGAIATTVLFARDGYNYRRLMHALGIKTAQIAAPPKPARSTQKYKGKRLKDVPVDVDPIVFKRPIKDGQSAFLRDMRQDGESLCKQFAAAGFKMSPWAPGTFSKKIYECWSEETYPGADDPNNQSTFFLMVKGAPAGEILSTRVKFIFNNQATRDDLIGKAAKVLTLYAKELHWADLLDHVNDIQALKPFSIDAFGLDVKFTAEFSAPGRYNLIMSRDANMSREEKRTRFFFDRSEYLPQRSSAGEYLYTPDDKAPAKAVTTMTSKRKQPVEIRDAP